MDDRRTQDAPMDPLCGVRTGDRVSTVTGDLRPHGTVIAVMATSRGTYMAAVELDALDAVLLLRPRELSVVRDSDWLRRHEDDRAGTPVRPLTPFMDLSAARCPYCQGPAHPIGEGCPSMFISCGDKP